MIRPEEPQPPGSVQRDRRRSCRAQNCRPSSSASRAARAGSASSTARCSTCRTARSRSSSGIPQIFRIHHDRPIQGHNYRTSLTIGARAVQRAGLHRRRHRRRGHRLGHHGLARRPDESLDHAVSVRQPARVGVRRLRQRPARSRTTTRATARTSPASSPATATTRTATRRRRARRQSRLAEGARRRGQRHDQQHHRGARLGAGESRRATTSASSTCRSARASTSRTWTDPLTLAAKRVVDAGVVVVAAAGNLGKNANGQPQYGGITAPGNAPVGADGRRLQHERHARPRRRHDGATTARAGRRTSTMPRSPTWSRPATARCRWPIRSARSTRPRRQFLLGGSVEHGVQAVPDAERHEHGGAGRGRHGGADAAGEPDADAERGEGHPAVHRAGSTRATTR